MIGCGVAFVAFGLLQMYEMGQSIASEDWTMTAECNWRKSNYVFGSIAILYGGEGMTPGPILDDEDDSIYR